jgi:GTP cyclohydrolase IA
MNRQGNAEHKNDEAAESAVQQLLQALGEDPFSPRLRETPKRVVAMLREASLRDPLPEPTFIEGPATKELVFVRGIPFQSLCEHHLLPFRGVAHVGYLPGDQLVGVSLPVQVVTHFSRGLQLQERMTENVVTWLDEHLKAHGVGVVLEAQHQCMSFRGIGNAETTLRTSAFRGALKNVPV